MAEAKLIANAIHGLEPEKKISFDAMMALIGVPAKNGDQSR